MPPLTMHHVSLPCRDLARSAAFYQDLFGFKRLERPPFHIEGVWLGCGSQQIHLIDNADGTFRDSPDISIVDTHFAFRTDDFDAALARLTASGFSETAPEGDPKTAVGAARRARRVPAALPPRPRLAHRRNQRRASLRSGGTAAE